MEKSLVEYKNDSASFVIVKPKVPVESDDESDLPYEVHGAEVFSLTSQEEEESISDPVPVVAEVDVSGISSTIICAVIVVCCFVSILRD